MALSKEITFFHLRPNTGKEFGVDLEPEQNDLEIGKGIGCPINVNNKKKVVNKIVEGESSSNAIWIMSEK